MNYTTNPSRPQSCKRNPAGRILLGSALALAALAASIPAGAVPAKKGVFSMTQPSGSTISVTLSGDEHFHRVYTTDGLPLIYTENLGYVYATLGNDGLPVASGVAASDENSRSSSELEFIAGLDIERLESAFRMQAGISIDRPDNKPNFRQTSPQTRGKGLCTTSFPRTGSPRGLVILVEYADLKFSMENPYDYFNRLLNEKGFSDAGATGSARDWFVDNSNGLFTPDFDLYGPVTLPQRRSYYGRNTGVGQDDDKPQRMAVHALEILDDEIDFKKYDCDNDGFIDNVYIFYAGQGEADGGPANSVWPHSWDLTVAEPKTKYVFDNVQLDHYACSNEYALDGSYPDAMKPAGIGTFVHEFSHVLGLPDLYSTSNYSESWTPGEFSVLDYGPYNNEGRTPPNYSSFERYALDWIEPERLTDSDNFELSPIHLSNKAYIIPVINKPSEFYMIESRWGKEGESDFYLPGWGMLVWHIDVVQQLWDDNVVNNDASHQYVDLIEADNRRDKSTYDGDPFPGEFNVTEFSSTSSPALLSWAGDKLFVDLYDISFDKSTGIVRFRAEVDKSEIGDITTTDKVWTKHGLINTTYQHPCCVYDAVGRLVGHTSANAPLRVASPGIHIVVTPETSVKVIIR